MSLLPGGIEIHAGLAMLGRSGTRDRVADLDLVATSIEALSAGAVRQFSFSLSRCAWNTAAQHPLAADGGQRDHGR